MKTQLKADMMLLIVAMLWGSSCLLTKIALEDLDEFNLVAFRFILGFSLAFPVFFKSLKIDVKTIGYSAIIATNYFVVLALMTFGVNYTTVSKAGFLTCLAGVFIPLINIIVFGKKPGAKIMFCAVATLAGVYLLTMGGTTGGSGINLGDVLCTLCSLFFAIQVMLVAHFVRRADAITLTVFQMGFVGLYNLAASFIFEAPHLPTTQSSWISSLLLCIGCTIIALLMQNIAQKSTSDTHAGIIFSTEPVFAVISAYVVLGETLSRTGWAGAVILLLCIVLLEVNFKSRN